ncbi:MAG: O-antigen ligase family protein [Gammaproteobacteria bacterium]|nr:O-antigen ligase family protein [Gammaproteobacteria bacterium]
MPAAWLPGALTSLALIALGPVAVFASRAYIVELLVLCLLSIMILARSSGCGALSDSSYGAVIGARSGSLARSGAWSGRCLPVLGVFLVYLAVAALRAEDLPGALVELGEDLLIILPSVLLAVAATRMPSLLQRRFGARYVLGIVLLAILLLFELLSSGWLGMLVKGEGAAGLRYLNHPAAMLPLLLWPALALAVVLMAGTRPALDTASRPAPPGALAELPNAVGARRMLLPAAAWSAALVVTCLSPVGAATLSLLAGGGLFVLGWWGRRSVLLALAGLVALVFLSAPLLLGRADTMAALQQRGLTVPASWTHRLVIWQYFSEASLRKPLLGHGLRASHFSNAGPEQRQRYQALARQTGNAAIAREFPTHPHNTILQLWFELGLVGVVLFLWLLGTSVALCWRLIGGTSTQRLVGASGLGMLGAYLVLSNLSFGAGQKWWLATLGIAVFGWALARSLSAPESSTVVDPATSGRPTGGATRPA